MMAAVDRGARAIDETHQTAIKTACYAARNVISRTLLEFDDFVHAVPESRPEVDDIASLLESLDSVLRSIRHQADAFPPQLASLTPALLDRSCAIIGELEGCIAVLGRKGIPLAEKQTRWTASREHIGKLEATLLGYKVVLWLAVDLVAAIQNEQRIDGHWSLDHELLETDYGPGEQADMSRMASRITETCRHLQREAQHNAALGGLRPYLDELHDFAKTAIEMKRKGADIMFRNRQPPSNAPDSAVAMVHDELPIILAADPARTKAPSTTNRPLRDVDELLDRLSNLSQDRRPPTPPPKSRARAKSAPMPRADNLTTSTVIPLPPQQSPVTQSPWTPSSPLPLHERRMIHRTGSDIEAGNMIHAFPLAPRHQGHIADMEADKRHLRRATESRLSSAFTITDIDIVDKTTDQQRQMSATRPHWQGFPQSGLDPLGSANGSTTTISASPPSHKRGKSSSSRFSSFVSRSLSLRRHRAGSTSSTRNPNIAGTTPANASASIFGSSISASMEVARGLAPVTLASGRTTTQAFPLCVLRCVYFIRSASHHNMDGDAGEAGEQSGLMIPHIFGISPSRDRLSNLINIFSSPSTGYGKEIDWSRFNVHDAAGLILHFMSSLPSPLVSEAVVKRWVSMSRQATVSGSAGTRLDQGMDFWEEALQGIKGRREMGTVKLLLGLWGEIAQHAETNEMTAERLAGCVMGALMGEGTARGKNSTDCLLSLAFMIRRRAEETGEGMATGSRGGWTTPFER